MNSSQRRVPSDDPSTLERQESLPEVGPQGIPVYIKDGERRTFSLRLRWLGLGSPIVPLVQASQSHIGTALRYDSKGLATQTYLGTSRLSGVGMMFVSRWPGQESNTEIAFITDLAAEWAYEKNSVKDLLQEPFSSGPVGYRAGTIRTKRRPTEDRHGPHLPFWLGSHSTSKSPIAKRRNSRTSERHGTEASRHRRARLWLPTALFYSAFAPYALVSCVARRAWVSQHSKGNRTYTEGSRPCNKIH
jgi:hypothetical protein